MIDACFTAASLVHIVIEAFFLAVGIFAACVIVNSVRSAL